MSLSALAGGFFAGAWWLNKAMGENARSAGGNLSLVEAVSADWLNDLATRGAPYRETFAAVEDIHSMPRHLLARLAWQESRFRADIITGRTVSQAGALGIMQIVPKWHPSMTPADCLNPAKAIPYAGGYLAQLRRQFGSWELALKAYNWGPGNLKKWLAAGKTGEPAETARYSAQILADVRAYHGGNIA